MRNARLAELYAEIKIARKNTKNLPFNGRKRRGTQEPLEGGAKWKRQLKTLKKKKKIQKPKITASGPTTSWQIEGEKVEAVTDFSFSVLESLPMLTVVLKLEEDDCFLAWKLWQT